jgi:hypothetical protein
MSPRRSRYVTACQQLLALGVVLAALTPAASVVSLDVVGSAPGRAPATPAWSRVETTAHWESAARAQASRALVVLRSPTSRVVPDHLGRPQP